MSKARPRYLDLFRIRLPVPAFVSILHRVTGAVLFLLIPVLLYLWQMSLQSPETFAAFKAFMRRPLAKLVDPRHRVPAPPQRPMQSPLAGDIQVKVRHGVITMRAASLRRVVSDRDPTRAQSGRARRNALPRDEVVQG